MVFELELRVDEDGLITIAGGKLTTYRKMAVEIVDKVVEMLRITGHLPMEQQLATAKTADEPLPGAMGWPDHDDHHEIASKVREKSGELLSEETALMLTSCYGMRAFDIASMIKNEPSLGELLVDGRAEILAQVDFAVQKELAVRLSDLLIRRTQIFFRDTDQGLELADKVAERMGSLLNWSDSRIAEELLLYQEEVARSRRWREG